MTEPTQPEPYRNRDDREGLIERRREGAGGQYDWYWYATCASAQEAEAFLAELRSRSPAEAGQYRIKPKGKPLKT